MAAWGLGLGLVALHLFPPLEPGPRLVAGWVPEELAWRLGWMALAWLYLVWFCARVWRPEDADAPGAPQERGGR